MMLKIERKDFYWVFGNLGLMSGEILKILRAIMTKLEEIDERLKRIEEEFLDELTEEELKELKEDLKAYKEGKLELIDLEELERELQSQSK